MFHRLFEEFSTIFISTMQMTYFSDGAGSQYMNRKNFLNLCHHKEDFGIVAEWHFFCHCPWERSLWWSWRDSKTTCCLCKLTKAIQRADQDSTPIVWLGFNQHTIRSLHLLQHSRLRSESQEPERTPLQNPNHTWHVKAPFFCSSFKGQDRIKTILRINHQQRGESLLW